MPEVPPDNNGQEAQNQEPNDLETRKNHVLIFRLIFIGVIGLGGGILGKILLSSDEDQRPPTAEEQVEEKELSTTERLLAKGIPIIPYEMPEDERRLNDEVNAGLLERGYYMAGNGNAIAPDKTEKEGKIVRLILPGSRKESVFTEQGKIIKVKQSPQQIPLNEEDCVELVWRLNECVNRKIGTDMRINHGWRSCAWQDVANENMRSRDSQAVVCQAGRSPHNTGQCHIDISASDAHDRIPYRNEQGEIVWLDEGASREIILDIRGGLRGMHILVIEECGAEVGITGGFCPGGVKRDPWHAYATDLATCERGSESWNRKFKALRDHPPGVEMDGIKGVVSRISVRTKRIYAEGRNGVDRAIEWTKDEENLKRTKELIRKGKEGAERAYDWARDEETKKKARETLRKGQEGAGKAYDWAKDVWNDRGKKQ